MTPAKAVDGDIFDSYVAYLRQSATQVENGIPIGEGGRV